MDNDVGLKFKLVGLLQLIISLYAANLENVSSPQHQYNAQSFSTSDDVTDIIGFGGFGVVRRCRHEGLGYVAVKCISLQGSRPTVKKNLQEATSRLKLLVRCKHTNIVQVYGMTSWGSRCFGIILEEMKCGNFQDLMINRQDIKDIPWELRFSFILQIAMALHYLHCHDPKQSFIHLDLKLENILLSMDMTVKLADFCAMNLALATGATPTTNISKSKQCTIYYSAPERLKDATLQATCAMDVYRQVYEECEMKIASLQFMIAEGGEHTNKKLIDAVKIEVEKSDNCNNSLIFEELKKVMERCWSFNPKDRPLMRDVCCLLTIFGNLKIPIQSAIKGQTKLIANKLSQSSEEKETIQRVSLSSHFPPFDRCHHHDDHVGGRKASFSLQASEAAISGMSISKKEREYQGEFLAMQRKNVWKYNTATNQLSRLPVQEGGAEIEQLSSNLLRTANKANKLKKSSSTEMQDLSDELKKKNNSNVADIEKYKIEDIEFHHEQDGLGFAIIGGYVSTHGNLPLLVKTVLPVGAAAVDGRLKRGDWILEVNGEKLDGCTHEEAVEALKRRSNVIVLKVLHA